MAKMICFFCRSTVKVPCTHYHHDPVEMPTLDALSFSLRYVEDAKRGKELMESRWQDKKAEKHG